MAPQPIDRENPESRYPEPGLPLVGEALWHDRVPISAGGSPAQMVLYLLLASPPKASDAVTNLDMMVPVPL